MQAYQALSLAQVALFPHPWGLGISRKKKLPELGILFRSGLPRLRPSLLSDYLVFPSRSETDMAFSFAFQMCSFSQN